MKIETQLPVNGAGFTTKEGANRGHQYGQASTIASIVKVGAAWETDSAVKFSVGEISKRGGGLLPPHKSHRTGLDIDVRPLRRDKQNLPVTIADSQYDRALTKRLIEQWLRLASVEFVLFNDPETIRAGLSRSSPGHENHLHVRLKQQNESGPRILKLENPNLRGEDVLRLQKALGARGHTISADGVLGFGTEKVIKNFQSENGLTEDGIVGSQTWDALLRTK